MAFNFGNLAPVIGGGAGYLAGGPWGAAIGAGLGSSLIGTDNGTPGYNASGVNAMSPSGQQSVGNYTDYLNQFGPSGFQAGQYNPYQTNALNSLGQPDFSPQGLENYLNPFQKLKTAHLNDINKSFDQSQGNFLSRFGGLGNGKGGLDSSIAKGLAELETGRNQTLGSAEGDFILQALGLQRQSLYDQLQAGNQLYGQQEAMSPYGTAQRYGGLLSAIPQGSYGTNGTGPTKNNFGKFGDVALAAPFLYNQLNQMNAPTGNTSIPNNGKFDIGQAYQPKFSFGG